LITCGLASLSVDAAKPLLNQVLDAAAHAEEGAGIIALAGDGQQEAIARPLDSSSWCFGAAAAVWETRKQL
jgi:hypothetical protein